MFDRDLFGAALIRLRGKTSQRQAARMAGTPTGTWCQWERGTRSPQASQIPKILAGLNCTEHDIRLEMWRLQAERFQMQGSELGPDSLQALDARKNELKELLKANLKRIPGSVRGPVIRLRASIAQAQEQLVAVQSDLEAIIVALGQESS